MAQAPKDPQLPMMLGLVLIQQNKRAEARQAFETSIALSPDWPAALEPLLNLELAEKRHPEAMERLRQQMQKRPNLAQLWLLLAKVHVAQKQNNEAETALLKAIELNPNLTLSYLLLAQLYIDSNRQQQALERLNGFAQRTNDVSVLMQLGVLHQHLKDYPRARDAYEKLLTVNPNFSPALNNLAYLYSEHLGQFDRAVSMAEKARKLLPYEPATADTLGWILFRKGDYTRALALLQESAAKLTEGEVQYHLGMVCYRLGDEAAARAAFERAAQSLEEFPAKDQVARYLAVLGTEGLSQKELETRAQADGNDSIVLSRLAAVYEKGGDFGKAVNAAERALKANPQNAQLMFRLARLRYFRLGETKPALALATDAHKLAPEDASISYLLGRLVREEGSNSKWALSLLEESARKLGDDPEVLYDLGLARYSQGRVADAEAAAGRALQAGGAFARAAEARRFLALVGAGKDPASAQQAESQARQVLGSAPNDAPSWMVVALCQAQRGDYQGAKASYDKVLAIHPAFTPAARELALLCADRLGEDQKAYPLAVAARAAYPNDAVLARSFGKLLYRRAEYSRAVPILQECAQRQPRDPEVYYTLGLALHRLKKPVESKAALERALALNLAPGLAAEAKRVLAELK